MRSWVRALQTIAPAAATVALCAWASGSPGLAGATAPRPASAGHVAGIGAFVPTHAGAALPRSGTAVDSLNWSGYAVSRPAGGITAVAATFTVPAAGLVPPGFAATWAGIGGYSTSDLIQAGVAEQSLPSLPGVGPQYDAWVETLPTASVPLTGCSGEPGCTVTPGDHVSVTIHLVRSGTWSVTVTDAGKWRWSNQLAYDSTESSAEWILEAPELAAAPTLMAPVGTVAFGPTSTFTDGGVTQTIAQGDPVSIDLSPGIGAIAEPSPLAPDGQSFDACAYALTCPAP